MVRCARVLVVVSTLWYGFCGTWLRTQEVARALGPEDWEELIEFTDTARAAAAGAFAPNTPWVEGVGYKPWQGHSRATQLASSAIAHNAMHLGEAVTIRSLAGFPLGV